MPDTGCLLLALLGLMMGSLLFLQPSALLKVSTRMNRTVTVLDKWLIKHRYVMGVLAFAAGYAFFKLALLLPSLRS